MGTEQRKTCPSSCLYFNIDPPSPASPAPSATPTYHVNILRSSPAATSAFPSSCSVLRVSSDTASTCYPGGPSRFSDTRTNQGNASHPHIWSNSYSASFAHSTGPSPIYPTHMGKSSPFSLSTFPSYSSFATTTTTTKPIPSSSAIRWRSPSRNMEWTRI